MVAIGQEHEESVGQEELEFKRHQLGVMLGHNNISHGIVDDKRQWSRLPSFALNYNYRFNNTWAVGLHTDIIVETFAVESQYRSDAEILEREFPVAPALLLVYRPFEHFSFLVGPGCEFEKTENLLLLRAETAYSREMGNELEFEAGFGYDIRIDAYDSWSLTVGILKAF
jgi:hypothetical protein